MAHYVGKWLHLANSTQSAEPKPFSVRCKLVLPRRSSDTKLTDSIRKEKRPTTPPPSRRTLKPPKMEGLLRISRGALEFTPRDPRGKSTHLDLAKIVGVDIERNKTPPPSHPPPSRFDRENSTRWKYDPFLNPPPIPENDGKWNEGGEYVLRVEMEMGGKLSFEGGNDLLTAHRVLMAAISSRSYQKIQPQKSHALDTKSAVQDPNNENSRKDGLSGAAIEIEGESGIAKEDEMRLLVCAMPSLYQLYTWRRVYTLTKDGASLEAVRRLVQSFRQILMLVMESTHQVFGAFITHTTLETRTGKKAAFFSPSLKPGALVGTNTAPTLFFGNGECFVFSIGGGKVERSVKVYRWSGKNDMHVCITNSIITIGGGGNGPAIKLGIHLKEGETNACDTYASPSLVSQVSEKGEEGDSRKRVEDGGPKEFICYDIEIWAAF
uniref:Oxidation resistance protein 1 n=1 Tax=Amorphochlora amoebiformis TaxID=1561963 RepID=A0A7S0DM10_9EUKA